MSHPVIAMYSFACNAVFDAAEIYRTESSYEAVWHVEPDQVLPYWCAAIFLCEL